MTTFAQFVEALVEPQKRAAIGLVITDAEATALIGNREWAENYFAQWTALATPPASALPPLDQRPAQRLPPQQLPAQQLPPQQLPPRPTVYNNGGVPPVARSGKNSTALWIALGVVAAIVILGIVMVIVFIGVISAAPTAVSQPTATASAPSPVPTPSATVAPSTRTPVDVSQRKGDTSGGYVSPFTESQQWSIDEFKRAGGFSTSARQVLGGADIVEVQDVDKDLLPYFDQKCDAGIAEPQNFDFYVDLLVVEGDYTAEKSGRVVDVIIDYCEGRPVAG